MQGQYPPAFEREMGCTADELRAWLPGASGGRALHWREQGVDVALSWVTATATATIDWRPLSPRRIALITLPRLAVRFDAQGTDVDEWQRFMRYFDLYTQRGGG